MNLQEFRRQMEKNHHDLLSNAEEQNAAGDLIDSYCAGIGAVIAPLPKHQRDAILTEVVKTIQRGAAQQYGIMGHPHFHDKAGGER